MKGSRLWGGEAIGVLAVGGEGARWCVCLLACCLIQELPCDQGSRGPWERYGRNWFKEHTAHACQLACPLLALLDGRRNSDLCVVTKIPVWKSL